MLLRDVCDEGRGYIYDMVIKLNPHMCFGFWKESERHVKYFESASFPRLSIHDFLTREMDPEVDSKVLDYLRNGHCFLGDRGIGNSVLEPDVSISNDLSFFFDGKWLWLSNLLYYYEVANLALPTPFFENILSNNFVPPSFTTEERKSIISQFKEIVKR